MSVHWNQQNEPLRCRRHRALRSPATTWATSTHRAFMGRYILPTASFLLYARPAIGSPSADLYPQQQHHIRHPLQPAPPLAPKCASPLDVRPLTTCSPCS